MFTHEIPVPVTLGQEPDPLSIDQIKGDTYVTKPKFHPNLEQALVSYPGDEEEEKVTSRNMHHILQRPGTRQAV